MKKEEIIRAVINNYCIDRKKLLKSTKHINCEARFVCIYLLHNYANFNKTLAARVFLKDHASAIYAINKVNDLITIDKKFARKIESLKYNLGIND